ncbi:MAG: hypothetical protein N0E48_22590 [Candidatus Thiodiazotropha endolucinida]|nr:hypothetical protein [Candidatus Thiodiazotropha taylori]MCW4346123.1 hypothetical protein [Candidatus Thiodiazotropha endolucinida]
MSNSRKNTENSIGNSESKTGKNSSEFSTPFGFDGLMHRNSSSCTSIHETNTASSAAFLETSISESPGQNSSKQLFARPLNVVAKGRKFAPRETIHSLEKFKSLNNRCFQKRLRGPFEQSNISRSLDKTGEKFTHQQSRVGSSDPLSTAFSSSTQGSQCLNKNRQYDCGTVCEQTGGNSFHPAMLSGMESVEDGNRQWHVSDLSTLIRPSEHVGRRFKQDKNTPNRMDSERHSSSEDFSFMGYTHDRSVRNRAESQSSNVLFMATKPVSIGNRRLIHFLGKHGRLCVPTSDSHSQGTTTYEEFSVPTNSDCPTVAQEELVHGHSPNVDRLSSEASYTAELASATENQNISPQASGLQSGCMEAIDKSFENKGFSEGSRKLLAASWRAGTQKDYAVKFNRFHSWCGEREIDPYKATITECADFLSSLFQSGLKYRTIGGYRSMLSAILPPVDNVSVGQHPHIIRLLKGVFNSRPPQKKLVPEWDLQRVLDFLSGDLFEPLSKIHLKYLTLKTVFLIAVTTFRRCGDIQALMIGEGFMSVLPEGIIFIRQGLAKQDRPSHVGRKIFVPCFRKNSKLDPKRAVQIYINRTSKLRGKDSENQVNNLFISYQKPHNSVSKQTIASWIVNVVKQAYDDPKFKVKAHSTRAIGPSWALFKGASLSSILEAADWSKDSVFKQFYYREIESHDWEL